MGQYESVPVEPRGNKSLDEWVTHIANILVMTQEEIENLLGGRLSSLNIRELTADKIRTGELLAALVTIRANLTGAAFIRLDGNGLVINDGTRDVLVADINGNVTMTSSTVQSTATGERVVIDDTGIHTYNASNIERITIGTTPAKGVKGITTRDELGVEQGVYTYDAETVDGASRTGQYVTAHGCYLLFDDSGDVRMQDAAGKGFRTSAAGYPEMNDGFGWASIAKKGISGSFFVASTSGGAPTTLATFTNGVLTSLV